MIQLQSHNRIKIQLPLWNHYIPTQLYLNNSLVHDINWYFAIDFRYSDLVGSCLRVGGNSFQYQWQSFNDFSSLYWCSELRMHICINRTCQCWAKPVAQQYVTYSRRRQRLRWGGLSLGAVAGWRDVRGRKSKQTWPNENQFTAHRTRSEIQV